MKIKCRVVSSQYQAEAWNDFDLDGICYSGRTPLEEADALVALYDPTEELLAFNGPKLWFTMEPSWHHHFTRNPVGRRLIATLKKDKHLWFGNPDPRFRVPHPTYRNTTTVVRNDQRKSKAVACVNNFGGRGWFLKKHFQLRNRFILSDLVELYGNPAAWAEFRWYPQLWKKGLPPNHAGRASPGNGYYDSAYLEFLSGFKVAVCLENWAEPYYFTEKFVNAARAGCIPVYHAHQTVKDSFLHGARWVDPADFDFSPKRTIEFALNQSRETYASANEAWLKSGILDDTDDAKTFQWIHKILLEKITTLT